jgi:hypothetical protein
MKCVEATGRWCFGLLNPGSGKMGALCLAIVGVALSLASPTQALAQQKAGNPVGLWSTEAVINGVQLSQVLLVKADGTCEATTVAGFVVLHSTGRWTSANGVATTRYDDGNWEKGSGVWINPNTYVYTCLDSSVQEAIGLRLVYKRVR